MASTDAKPVPQKNVAYRVTFAILDADGDLVTGATGLDSEVSKDGGTFADATSEATEIATASGMYYLDLTATEMNADTVAVIVKTSSSGAKTTTIVMYPEEAGDIRVNVTAFGGTAGTFSAGRPEVNTTHAAGTAWASGAIVAGTFAADAITAAKLAADVTTELQAGLATAAALTTVGNNVTTIAGYLDTEIGTIVTAVDTTIPAQISALNNLSAAQVNTEVVDALNVDTYAEPGLGAPGATISIAAKINYLFKAWRNKVTQTTSEYVLYADDGTTRHHAAAVVDDGSTFTKSEVGSG